jgi:hypothetical protein
MNQDTLDKHMMCGYLFKKKSNLAEKLIQAKKRWFILVSEEKLRNEV